MANLNLSQFTEKTFVADADWVFVWDTAGAISKKVSRNNWLNSGTLATSAPVTISQTWDALAVEFTAFKVNATSTNSAAGSLLLDLQVGGVSYVKIGRNGLISVADSVGSGGFVFRPGNTQSGGIGYLSGGGYGVWAGAGAAIGFSTGAALIGSIQTALYTDGAGQLALRNGAAAQTFNVYGTYTSITDYRRLSISVDNTTGNATILANKGSATTGDVGTVSINGVPVGLGKGSFTTNLAIGTTALNANTADSYNTGIGYQAGRFTTSGYFNTFVGARAGTNLTTGNSNSAFGLDSLGTVSTGANNSAFGLNALGSIGTTSQNTAIGTSAGFLLPVSGYNSASANSVFIGYDTRPAADSQTNQIVIGHSAVGLGSNTAVLGNASITTTALRGNVGIGTTAPAANLEVFQPTTGVGTISVGAGGTTITGVGTQFTNTFKLGDTITSAGQTLTVGTISSDTVMTCGAAGAAITSQPYTLVGGSRLSVSGAGDMVLRSGRTTQLRIISNTGTNVFNGLTIETSSTLAGFQVNTNSGEVKIGALSNGGYFPTFYSNNVEVMRISTAGNVGIGTTAPSSKLHVVGDASISGNISLSNGSVTVLGGRGFTLTPGDGIFQFLNNAQTGFDRIQLGGASTGHPAIKRNGASIDITLASDGITFTSIQDLYRRFGAGSPEGVVIAPTGAVYHNTSGGAATTFYVKESSPTPSTGWVGK